MMTTDPACMDPISVCRGLDRPLIVQSDGTLLLEANGPHSCDAQVALCAFAHLECSPEYVHTYRITPLSLWNAAAAGRNADWIEAILESYSRYPVPELVRRQIRDQIGRFGQARLLPHGAEHMEVYVPDPYVRLELSRHQQLTPFWQAPLADGFLASLADRGPLKQALIRAGYPADDLCGYQDGLPLELGLRRVTRAGKPFALRPYQEEAVDCFHAGGRKEGGAGIVALPCGSGKTAVAMGVIERLQASTLILTTNTVAVRQWRDELLDKTTLQPEDIGEYTGEAKCIRPVTLTTYQMLTHRDSRSDDFPHLDLIRSHPWGLLVYDEVHMLPAPVFRATSEIQVRRRLGLTATLVREDGREEDVFALIGPKRFELAWKTLESRGYIATAACSEIRLEMSEPLRIEYALALERDKFRLAAENPRKRAVAENLIARHPDESILIIGQYLDQLKGLARDLLCPLITGSTPNRERERLFAAFREGRERILVVSKVANFAIDLPDASVAIQVSGTYGSRQEEAQRLGRLLRPKARQANFYTLVSRDTCEQDFAARRQRFLVEQGYRYQVVDENAR